jgi:hypothetical protein
MCNLLIRIVKLLFGQDLFITNTSILLDDTFHHYSNVATNINVRVYRSLKVPRNIVFILLSNSDCVQSFVYFF